MPNSSKVILVVDDDEPFLRVVEAILLRGGYLPITARSNGITEGFHTNMEVLPTSTASSLWSRDSLFLVSAVGIEPTT